MKKPAIDLTDALKHAANKHTDRTTEETDNRRSIAARLNRLRSIAARLNRLRDRVKRAEDADDLSKAVLGILDLLEDEL